MTNTERTQQLARLHARLARLGWQIVVADDQPDWREGWRLRQEWKATDAERERIVAESETEVEHGM